MANEGRISGSIPKAMTPVGFEGAVTRRNHLQHYDPFFYLYHICHAGEVEIPELLM